MAQVIAAGLAAASSLYELQADGRRVFRGTRPSEEWIGHGTFARRLFTLRSGQLVRITVYKQRWRLRGTTKTTHSRPPDDVASVWFCSLIVALCLWGWLSSAVGLHHHEPATAALSSTPSARTVQRWLRRALPHADETATALRRAVIERSEPRPMESYVGGGLSPPKRRWGDPSAVSTLRSGLSLLYEGAMALDVHVSILLAEARGRQLVRQSWFL
jgi:hypothetical protein